MSLLEKLNTDLQAAIKTRDEVKTTVLRQIKSTAMLEENRKNKTLSDEDLTGVIFSILKSHNDSIESFKKGNRQDLVDKEEKELAIIKTYLPEQLTDDEIRAIVEAAVKETGAKDMKETGKVMAKIMTKVKGKADGNKVSALVKEKLQKQV